MFVNAIFPNPKRIHGLQIEKVRPSSIVGNNQVEQRIAKLQHYRTIWSWPTYPMLAERRKLIESFIQDTAEFAQNSFKFRAPNSNKWLLTPLQYAGSSNYFKLTERGAGDTHPIFHLDTDVTVRIGGTPATFTKLIYNGAPVIAVTGATSGSSVTISGGFFYSVRLNQSGVAYAMTALNGDNSSYADTLSDISLIEVFEY